MKTATIRDRERPVERFLAAWNAGATRARQAHLHAACGARVVFLDARATVHGRLALDAYIAACRREQPAARWWVTEVAVDADGRFRCIWILTDAASRCVVRGSAVGMLDATGRIAEFVSVIDRIEPWSDIAQALGAATGV